MHSQREMKKIRTGWKEIMNELRKGARNRLNGRL